MGEVMPIDQGDSSSGSVQPKLEPLPDVYDSTPEGSSPEAEGDAPQQPDAAPVIVKRKGGRKPIYATVEERKQRNRQAQAAFRERRTEYIKQLQETIKQQETQLQSLQQSHRSAADECLMLRYKNSLLERLLLEKGIDVQAELRMKGSPSTGPNRPSAAFSTSHASPMQRAMINRQQHARANSNVSSLPRQNTAPSSQSPTFQTTPSSHHSSPSTGKSPTGFIVQGGISPTTSDIQAQQQMQPRPKNPQQPAQTTTFINHTIPPQPRRPPPPPSTKPYQAPSSAISTGGFYPTSSFQKHYDQLEQEYAHDAQVDMMVDQPDADSTIDTPADTFPANFGQQPLAIPQQQQQNPPHPQRAHPGAQSQMQQQQTSPPTSPGHNIFAHGPGDPLFDPFDPMLDADPFGLTASMHFPTPFSFDQPPQHVAGQRGQTKDGQDPS